MKTPIGNAIVAEIITDKEIIIDDFYWFCATDTEYVESSAQVVETHNGYTLVGYSKKIQEQYEEEFR